MYHGISSINWGQFSGQICWSTANRFNSTDHPSDSWLNIQSLLAMLMIQMVILHLRFQLH